MRRRVSEASILAIFASMTLARCFDEPDYSGLACSVEALCPQGFVCTEQGVCARPGEDAGRPDGAVPPECSGPGDCDAPGPCEEVDERVDCIAGVCRYPSKVCDDPPPGECIDGDTKYRSFSGVGKCEAEEGCVYPEVVIDCLDCGASCLLRCEGLVCNDGNGGCRTEGHCVPDEPPSCAYVSAPDSTPCDLDGLTGDEGYCKSGLCVECVEDEQCDDGNPCTEDLCLTETSTCSHAPISGICDDGDACTTVDTCVDGACLGSEPVVCEPAPGQCYESPGECDPTDGACVFTSKQPGVACDDENFCTTSDACMEGDCVGSAPLDCDDQNACTDDGCDPTTGCTHTDNADPCDDGNACTLQDNCSGGLCTPGSALDCNDGNPCTADACDPATGCTHTSVPDDTTCTFAGGLSGICLQGACVGCADDADCDDGNACTTATCVNQTCTYANNTNTCNDGNACTYSDHCAGGVCAGTAITCSSNACVTRTCNGTATCAQTFHNGASCADDGNACTNDVCNASGTCTHPTRANGSSCGSNSANRCCGGSCVNISTNESHCGGCNTACSSGLTCETVANTTSCSPHPANTSGRCRCNGSNAQCPRSQVCRTVTPFNNRCAPSSASNCASVFVDVSSCPNYCRY